MDSSRKVLSPDLALEHFGSKSIVLVASQDRLVTVNRAAAVLLELIIETFQDAEFTLEDLSVLLQEHYRDLKSSEAQVKAHDIVAEWLRLGIVSTARV